MGGELTANPLVRKLSFTGSTEVGAKLLAQCAPTIKKTSMELGGNAPFIVFDDADLDAGARARRRGDLRLARHQEIDPQRDRVGRRGGARGGVVRARGGGGARGAVGGARLPLGRPAGKV